MLDSSEKSCIFALSKQSNLSLLKLTAMTTYKNSTKLPRLYEANYRKFENGDYYTNLFVRLIDAIEFLKKLSEDYSYFFGYVYAFTREPNSIGALEYEGESLFQISKVNNKYFK